MTRAKISIRQSRAGQDDLRRQREHASVRPDFAAALGLDVGRQAIIRRDDGRFALYTLTDGTPEFAVDVSSMTTTPSPIGGSTRASSSS